MAAAVEGTVVLLHKLVEIRLVPVGLEGLAHLLEPLALGRMDLALVPVLSSSHGKEGHRCIFC